MILKIKDAMDSIRPDAGLLRRTETAMRAESARRKRRGRRILAAAAALAVCAGLSAGGYGYLHTTVSALYIDINPSLALDINRLGRVNDVRCLGSDAEPLVDAASLRGEKAADAVSQVMAAAGNAGYLSDDATVVSLAAVDCGGSAEKTGSLLTACAADVENRYANVAVYTAPVGSAPSGETAADTISPGKLHLIRMVQSLDKSATVDEYRGESVTGIMDHLVYLTSDENTGASAQSKADVLRDLGGVADRVRKKAPGKTGGRAPSAGAQQPAAQNSGQTASRQETESAAAAAEPAAQEGASGQAGTSAAAPQTEPAAAEPTAPAASGGTAQPSQSGTPPLSPDRPSQPPAGQTPSGAPQQQGASAPETCRTPPQETAAAPQAPASEAVSE